MAMASLPASLTISVLGVPGAEEAAVQALLAESEEAAAPHRHIVVDASALMDFDSSAISLLLQAQRQAQAGGRSLILKSAPRAMVELATLYGVAELLGLSLEEAKSEAAAQAPFTPA